MIKNIRFRNIYDDFQDELRKDKRQIKSSQKASIPADKTGNYYNLDKTMYKKLLTNNVTVTSNYKKARYNSDHIVNKRHITSPRTSFYRIERNAWLKDKHT